MCVCIYIYIHTYILCKRFHSAIVFYFKPLFLSNISQVLVS